MVRALLYHEVFVHFNICGHFTKVSGSHIVPDIFSNTLVRSNFIETVP
jgi:hypothetical protein